MMTGKTRSGVFLSYARKDGEQFAATLRERLHEKAPDIVVKQDSTLLQGGVGWWKQLADAIDSVEFLVLVMTPSSMQSETVRKEWRYARQQGVGVFPVKGASDSELPFSDLPRWMSNAHFFDIDREWESFLAHLRKGCDTPRVPFMAPDLPDNFTRRPDEFGQLKSLLLSEDRKDAVAITTALSGAGGFGKTTLASALCHDEDIIQNFYDGILWVTLGQNPNVMSSLITAFAGLTGDRPGFVNEEDAAFQLGEKLEDRTCLLVIDDVWDEAALRPFLRGGKGCARLFTTRNVEVASGARTVNVEEMRVSESLNMLTKGVPGLDSVTARDVSERLGEWPLALELAAAMMRQRIKQGDSAERAAIRLMQTLDRKGVGGLVKGTGDPQHRSIDGVLKGSLELLCRDDRARFTELSIFPQEIPIPIATAAALWGDDELESEETAERLARLSLVKLDLGNGLMRLHDVVRNWLASASETPNPIELHNRLVAAWGDWMRLPNGYAWRWLTWHLAQAARWTEIEKLLFDPPWLRAKLQATDVYALIGDFDHLKPMHEARLVQDALRLSSHILAKDPLQFPCQMTGRLLPYEGHVTVREFRTAIAQTADRPWLRTLKPVLATPGTALWRTLAGHSDSVLAVALTPDGRRALSASGDKTLKIWDLETGIEMHTLAGHAGSVNAVAVTPNGRHAVSASSDNTLKVWDLASGVEVCTLAGHSLSVNGVAVTPNGRHAVSASSDNTLKVWNLEFGIEARTLTGHSYAVYSVGVAPDGRRAVSASEDNTLKVWDLETGEELRTLAGHSASVNVVVLTRDGRRALSASRDTTLKVWDLETGVELFTLAGHAASVFSVAVTPDGRRAVSVSRDTTLKIWDLDTGNELHTLSGHSDWVIDVAITPDGQRAVSASRDTTLKIWNLDTAGELRTLACHSNWVIALAVTRDGRRAVSASYDNTLKVWDLENGVEVRTLAGHSDWVNALALTPDGQRVISASDDKTLKLWDLETGEELHILQGHSDRVNSVAIMPDGRRVVSAPDNKTLKHWDLETGEVLHILQGHSDRVNSVTVTPDGRHAVSASEDNTLRLWDLESGGQVRIFTGHSDPVNAVALTAGGRGVVSASDDTTLKLWDLETSREVHTLSGHTNSVNCVSVTPDGRRAVSASLDDTLKVWDLDTCKTVATFVCESCVRCCACADNRIFVAGDEGGRVYLLALEVPQAQLNPQSS